MSTLIWLVVTALAAGGTVAGSVHWLGRALDACRDWRLDHSADRSEL